MTPKVDYWTGKHKIAQVFFHHNIEIGDVAKAIRKYEKGVHTAFKDPKEELSIGDLERLSALVEGQNVNTLTWLIQNNPKP